jgi:hypothetical protein
MAKSTESRIFTYSQLHRLTELQVEPAPEKTIPIRMVTGQSAPDTKKKKICKNSNFNLLCSEFFFINLETFYQYVDGFP